jgi:pteridine reductase
MNSAALITGSSKRIGKAVAEHLASKGWDLVIHYNRSEKHARELTDSLSKKHPRQRFIIIKADLTSEIELGTLIPGASEEMRQISLLVNNASVFDSGYIHDTDYELFDRQFIVNLKAPFFLIRDFARYFKKGNIVNFTDTRITKNRSDYAAYSLSKKGLWELTKMAALEFAPDIRVNAIAPGLTLPPEGKGEDYLWKLAEKIPMKRPGSPEDVLKSLDYILDNEYITGQLLFADGGENLDRNEQ